MGKDIDINVHHVARVEGHGNIVVDVKNGEIKEVKLEIVESPRFFESMLVGRRFPEANHITSRICGICAVAHSLASLRAIEDALGIEPSWQTLTLRKILMEAEAMQSNVLHYYFLAAPDLVGASSIIPMASSHPEAIKTAIRWKKLSNDICDTLGGRHTQPISMAVDGFTNLVTAEEMESLLSRVKETLKTDAQFTLELFGKLKMPAFSRKTDYVSLSHPEEYALYEGKIRSSETGEYRHRDYKLKVNEFIVPHSTAKQAFGTVKPYMVGALARFNNNAGQLKPLAKKAADQLGLTAPDYNPYNNNAAQVVESVHNLERLIELIEGLLAAGIKEERIKRPPIAGWTAKLPPIKKSWGVGVVEAPRGLLIHEYKFSEDGLIEAANCVIPTGQNLANIEADIRRLVPEIIDKPKEEITLLLEMLVRAYDPCISCSTHMLKVDFIE